MSEVDLTTLVRNRFDQLDRWLRGNKRMWKPSMDQDILSQSNGEVRAFHIFFQTPDECFGETFVAQALEEKDMKAMYPFLIEECNNIKPTEYLAIFHCNNVGVGTGITSTSRIE